MSAEDADDTASFDAAERQKILSQTHAYTERRALIEQAKGMVMFAYGIDADAAFDVLRLQSQEHNVKLILIAEQILKDMVELGRSRGPARRMAFDGFMLTAHQRIANSAARQLDGQSKTGVPMRDLEGEQASRGNVS